MRQTAQKIKKDNELFLQNEMQSTDVFARYAQVFLHEIVILWINLRFTRNWEYVSYEQLWKCPRLIFGSEIPT